MQGLIVGYGYLGQRLGKLWLDRGLEVCALTRRPEKASELRSLGVRSVLGDWYDADSLPTLTANYVVICVSHAAVSGLAPEQTHVLGLENLFAKFAAPPQRVVYVSTTGVFAACYDGRWIDESGPVEANRPGTIAAVAAEAWLQQNVETPRLTILRAAGIYGPERIPNLDNLRNGLPLRVDPESWLNLIHVDDLAAVCAEAAASNTMSGIYCVADGSPVLRKDYYGFIADQIGAPPPEYEKQPAANSDLPTLSRRRGEGSKRISNQRLAASIGRPFRFPSFREGLRPLLVG